MIHARTFTTRDAVSLNYLETGSGETLVFLPGWSQTAAMFKHQLAAFAGDYHCLALDWRGHGDSGKPATGYRHSRLTMDLHEWLEALNLKDVTLIGHSMGCKIMWNYWEMFGAGRIARLVTIDQSPRLVAAPGWNEQQRADFGATTEYSDLEPFLVKLAGQTGEKTTHEFVPTMFTDSFPKEEIEWVIEENLKMPRLAAAFLLRETMLSDSRDILPTITLPTLVVAGEGSHIPTTSQRWIHKQIAGSSFASIPASEGGSHFCFLENPKSFNRILLDFLQSTPLGA